MQRIVKVSKAGAAATPAAKQAAALSEVAAQLAASSPGEEPEAGSAGLGALLGAYDSDSDDLSGASSPAPSSPVATGPPPAGSSPQNPAASSAATGGGGKDCKAVAVGANPLGAAEEPRHVEDFLDYGA